MCKRYFFRLDDIAPNMNWSNFFRIRDIFRRYGIKPLFAIIPDLKDSKLLDFEFNSDFWNVVRELSSDGWIVGQHGYQHLAKGDGGVLKIHSNGEFGGLDFDTQRAMIASGKEIITTRLVSPEVFIAPRHSFDENTVKALKINGFSYISDGIALYPFKKWGLIWLPQILWRPRKWLFGMITVALHSNTMADKDFDNLKEFIEKNPNKIGNFSELINWYSSANISKKFFAYWVNLIFRPFWWVVFKLKIRN